MARELPGADAKPCDLPPDQVEVSVTGMEDRTISVEKGSDELRVGVKGQSNWE